MVCSPEIETYKAEEDSFKGQFHVLLTKIHLSKEALKELYTPFAKNTEFYKKKKVRILEQLTKKVRLEFEEKFRNAIKKNHLEKYIDLFEIDGNELLVGTPLLNLYWNLTCRSHHRFILSKFVEELNIGVLQYEIYLPSDGRHLSIKLQGCCNTVDVGVGYVPGISPFFQK